MASSGVTISSFASKISQHITEYRQQDIHPHRKVKQKERSVKRTIKNKSPNKPQKYDYAESGIEYSNDILVENALLDGM
jgi:hypothetical protein